MKIGLKLILGFLAVSLLVGAVALILTSYAPAGKGPQTSDSSLLEVKQRGELIVGINFPYEPLEYFDESGNMVGLDVDIAKEIASSLGVSLEIKDFLWDELLEAVKADQVDLAVSGISITLERSNEMLFSIPYLYNGLVIITRSDDEEIKLPADLKGKKVGAINGSTWETEALKYTNSSLVISYDAPERMIGDLKSGQIDAIIYDYVLSGEKGLLKNEPSLKIVGAPFTQDYFGIATNKNNGALMDEINSILRELKRSGRLGEIQGEWI